MKYVYMMRAGEGLYKVGVAVSIDKRVRAIQTGNGHKVEVVAAKLYERPHEVEMALHMKLTEFRGTGGSEWFRLSDKEAIELAILLNNGPEVDVSDKLCIRAILDEQKSNSERIIKCMSNVEKALNRIEPQPSVVVEKEERPKRIVPSFNDELDRAIKVINDEGKASTSLLQRRMSIGYGKAAKIIDRLESRGLITPPDGIKPRRVVSQLIEI